MATDPRDPRPFASGVDIDAVHRRLESITEARKSRVETGGASAEYRQAVPDSVIPGPWPPQSTLADTIAQALTLSGHVAELGLTVKALIGGGVLIERKP